MPPHDSQIAAYILAGGRSSRMGADKALLDFRGRPLLTNLLQLVQGLGLKASIVGSPEKYRAFGVPIIEDRIAHAGPLAGIDAALHHSTAPWNLILSCDLPFLTPDWLQFLLDRTSSRAAADAIVPMNAGGPEPLCALYSRRSATAVAAALARGVRKVSDVYVDLLVDFISPGEWNLFDPHGLLFKNVNTPEDYESLRLAQPRD